MTKVRMGRRSAATSGAALAGGLTTLVVAAALLAGCGSTAPASTHASPSPTATTSSTSAGAASTSAASTAVPAPPVPAAPLTTVTSPPATSTVATAAEAAGLSRYLLRSGEEAGFTRSNGHGTFSNLKTWVEYTQLTAADKRQLRSEGFMAAAQQNIGNASEGGASFVEEFTTEAGARREARMDAEQAKQGGERVSFFSVPELPNSHGALITATGQAGTNLYWTEGRCTLWIGNGSATPLESQVVAAAESIYRRTQGACP